MSVRMRAVAAYLRLTAKPRMATAEAARRRMADPGPAAAAPAALRRRHEVDTRNVEGFPVTTVTPRGGATRTVLYLHGGAYVAGAAPQHWTLAGRLADAGARVVVPDYGLAPRHTYREAYRLLDALYPDLGDDVVLAGDSAGGGLALGFAQTLLGSGRPQPRQVALIAPWLDLALADPAVAVAEARDPWLSSAGLREAGRAWAGGDDPADPRLSPLHGPFAGLPPVRVWVGTRDLLYPDVLRLRDRAAAEGTRVEVTAVRRAVHVYSLTPTPEGRAGTRAFVAAVTG
ncbi:alpha/beta hydrolase fold domain-containing protein [Geodermatophilus nigrescens]|uniref:Acetyl esterase/lipase n=1 Tax=Geodermatophilus nigrescens TaxID=1070870 RepID=A0A1M5K184_9ACTN|nr:alpha/beta hydrolase fold domain-containing protein [Geodermatophilus nigrescens]SHG46300.1 Acetyl esterase/lipase [Geodermatophilus nigrescens]